jgi:bisphosphoglycerate-dependent phosphoglycerate mutase
MLKKITSNLKDAQLDEEGFYQAQRAGKFLKGYLYYNSNINLYFMASNLTRTQQTIGMIMKELNYINNSIYIVPCIHELINSGDGECDSSLLQYVPVASNTPTCNKDLLMDKSSRCYQLKNEYFDIKINWVYYYYNNYNSNYDCSKTNIIKEIINTFNYI